MNVVGSHAIANGIPVATVATVVPATISVCLTQLTINLKSATNDLTPKTMVL